MSKEYIFHAFVSLFLKDMFIKVWNSVFVTFSLEYSLSNGCVHYWPLVATKCQWPCHIATGTRGPCVDTRLLCPACRGHPVVSYPSQPSLVVTTSHIHRGWHRLNVSDIHSNSTSLSNNKYALITYSFMFFIATQTAQTQAEWLSL